MAEKSQSRRTSRTKKAICDAFAELMYEKELSKITVQELADRADVGRGTWDVQRSISITAISMMFMKRWKALF